MLKLVKNYTLVHLLYNVKNKTLDLSLLSNINFLKKIFFLLIFDLLISIYNIKKFNKDINCCCKTNILHIVPCEQFLHAHLQKNKVESYNEISHNLIKSCISFNLYNINDLLKN